MILLHGYYGERNAGDDAFTTICVERLSPREGPVRVMAAELPRVAGLHASTLLLRRRWWGMADRVEQRRIQASLAAGAKVVLGGGSLLRDSAGIAEVRRLLDASASRGHAALGVSIGPWRDAAAEAACAELLPRFDFVGVRDLPSLERAKAMAPSARIELTFDLAPLLMPAPSISRRRGGLGVALCGPMIDNRQLDQLERVLGAWLEARPERELVLLPFNVHPRKGDVAKHRALQTRLASRGKVALEAYGGDPRDVWQRIASLDGVVAMRLHAGIFGYCSQTPTLLVPYEEKSHAWAAMVGHAHQMMRSVDDLTQTDLEQLVTDAPLPTLPIPAARAAAARNFEAIGA